MASMYKNISEILEDVSAGRLTPEQADAEIELLHSEQPVNDAQGIPFEHAEQIPHAEQAKAQGSAAQRPSRSSVSGIFSSTITFDVDGNVSGIIGGGIAPGVHIGGKVDGMLGGGIGDGAQIDGNIGRRRSAEYRRRMEEGRSPGFRNPRREGCVLYLSEDEARQRGCSGRLAGIRRAAVIFSTSVRQPAYSAGIYLMKTLPLRTVSSQRKRLAEARFGQLFLASENRNSSPPSFRFLAEMRPLWYNTELRTIDSPSPDPPFLRLRPSSTR